MFLYNTLSAAREPFVPQDPSRITMYVCGPTVYSHPHIGNARPAVVFDVLYRLLRRDYGEEHVVYARNITDLDDKINAAAAAEGVPIGRITDRFTAVYHRDMEALGVLPPTIEPRATEHIKGMIAMIEKLLAHGHAYEGEGHVLFHVPSFSAYGRLSRRNREEMIDGARVEVAPYKRDPADFVLWKPSSGDLPGWDSPWGHGRPGWHLECSCMAEQHLGQTIDIHGGGGDLVFPHHENEIAQSTCAHDSAPFCRTWVHNGFVNVKSEKMAKSVGNVVLVRELLQRAPGEVVRIALLSTHYRKPLDWSDHTLKQAHRNLERLYRGLRGFTPGEGGGEATPSGAVLEALADDLNTPRALACLFDLARHARRILDQPRPQRSDEEQRRLKDMQQQLAAGGALMGILQDNPGAWDRSTTLAANATVEDIEAAVGGARAAQAAYIKERIVARSAARAGKDYAESDRIRDELLARFGIETEDRPEGPCYRVGGNETAAPAPDSGDSGDAARSGSA